MPIFKQNLKVEVWSETIDKMKRKLQQWGTQWLNLDGRVIVIKSILSVLLIHQYAILQALAITQKQIELILRKIL